MCVTACVSESKENTRDMAAKTAGCVILWKPWNSPTMILKCDSVLELVAQRCTELERGARMVDAMITNTMLPEIGREFLSRLATGSEIKRVSATAKDGNFSFIFE